MDFESDPSPLLDTVQVAWPYGLPGGGSPDNCRLLDYDLELASFTAPELERITGFPHHLQRLWRHRGHLEQRPRYAPSRYSSLELAQLCVRYRLSTCSLPPAESREIGAEAGRIVLFAALVSGAGDAGPANHRNPRLDLAIAARLCGANSAEERRFLWSADGSDFRLGRLSEAGILDGVHESHICIDLFVMGSRIASRAGRPLATVRAAWPL